MTERVPVLYVTDMAFETFDPADIFDLAALLRSPDHRLVGVCFAHSMGGERILDALSLRATPGGDIPPTAVGAEGLTNLLAAQDQPVNLIVVAGYTLVAAVLAETKELFREKVARLFVVGGYANVYGDADASVRRLPIDPRLRERYPRRFGADGDPRLPKAERAGWAVLLTSGQAVIFVPRDISLWSYAAPGLLAGGGACSDFLLRELFWRHLPVSADRYAATEQPVLLSTLPAMLLAVKPDPFIWMRLFRVITARIEVDTSATIASIDSASTAPNLYLIAAIDGQALGKFLTPLLRDDTAKPIVQ
jgi:hypothetical protein